MPTVFHCWLAVPDTTDAGPPMLLLSYLNCTDDPAGQLTQVALRFAVPESIAPGGGEVMETDDTPVLATITETGELVADPSVNDADRVCGPSLADAEFHPVEVEPFVTGTGNPMLVLGLSSLNCSIAPAGGFCTEAAMVVIPETWAPGAGVVILTLGRGGGGGFGGPPLPPPGPEHPAKTKHNKTNRFMCSSYVPRLGGLGKNEKILENLQWKGGLKTRHFYANAEKCQARFPLHCS